MINELTAHMRMWIWKHRLTKKSSIEVLMSLMHTPHGKLVQTPVKMDSHHIEWTKSEVKKAWKKVQEHKKTTRYYYADRRIHAKKASSEWVHEMWSILHPNYHRCCPRRASFLPLTNATIWLSNTHLNEIQINCTIYSYICRPLSVSICLPLTMGAKKIEEADGDITNFYVCVCISVQW